MSTGDTRKPDIEGIGVRWYKGLRNTTSSKQKTKIYTGSDPLTGNSPNPVDMGLYDRSHRLQKGTVELDEIVENVIEYGSTSSPDDMAPVVSDFVGCGGCVRSKILPLGPRRGSLLYSRSGGFQVEFRDIGPHTVH